MCAEHTCSNSHAKKRTNNGSFLWRRVRDSNPRKLALQRFSRPPLSTAQPTLHIKLCFFVISGRKKLSSRPYSQKYDECLQDILSTQPTQYFVLICGFYLLASCRMSDNNSLELIVESISLRDNFHY